MRCGNGGNAAAGGRRLRIAAVAGTGLLSDDLPDKLETRQYCPIDREQVTLYEAVLHNADTRMKEQGDPSRTPSPG